MTFVYIGGFIFVLLIVAVGGYVAMNGQKQEAEQQPPLASVVSTATGSTPEPSPAKSPVPAPSTDKGLEAESVPVDVDPEAPQEKAAETSSPKGEFAVAGLDEAA